MAWARSAGARPWSNRSRSIRAPRDGWVESRPARRSLPGLTGLRNQRCWVPRLAPSSMSVSAAIDSSARSRARGFRVNSTEVASARYSRSRLVDAWTSAEKSGRHEPQQAGDDQQEDPDEDPHHQPGKRVVAVAARGERAVLPAFDDETQEAVGGERDEADEDRDIERVAGVEVADVAELVADDALKLLAVHRLEQAARHRDRRVLPGRGRWRTRSGSRPG